MTMIKPVNTWVGQIFVGLRSEYSNIVHPINVVKDVCHEFVDEIGLCVTVTTTEFIYTGGEEPGAIIGFINYPRFPMEPDDLEDRIFALASRLKSCLGQLRVTIVMPDKTVTLGDY
jgi:hypothetical protein